jgi:hypothetical protein
MDAMLILTLLSISHQQTSIETRYHNDVNEHERYYRSIVFRVRVPVFGDEITIQVESDDSSITIAAETKDVNQWKIVVLVGAGIVAAICGAGTYAITQFKRKTIFHFQVRRLNDE